MGIFFTLNFSLIRNVTCLFYKCLIRGGHETYFVSAFMFGTLGL